MRVCIIGPVVTNAHTGGVATFDESLADAFKRKGCDTYLLTNRADKALTTYGAKIVAINSRFRLVYFVRSVRYMCKHPADLTIGSTWYDFGMRMSKGVPGYKVHYLHGFPVPRDGVLKAAAIIVNEKLRRKGCALIANSYFTKMINEVFFRLYADAVVPIGVSPTFCDIKETPSNEDRKYDVIYVGRVRFNKGANIILQAVKYVQERYGRKLRVAIVGNGPQIGQVIEYAKTEELLVDFPGRISIAETIDYYKNGKIFISLDPKEPYGQTFAEALVCGCRIICPNSGGQLEYLSGYPDQYFTVNSIDPCSVGEKINGCLNHSNYTPPEPSTVYNELSYDVTASKLLDVCERQRQIIS